MWHVDKSKDFHSSMTHDPSIDNEQKKVRNSCFWESYKKKVGAKDDTYNL